MVLHIADISTAKVKNCEHQFKRLCERGTNIEYQVCVKCKYKKKLPFKNESLTKYFRPASKQSTSKQTSKQSTSTPKQISTSTPKQISNCNNGILAGVVAFVADFQFRTNWLIMEHDGWRLPCTLNKYDWCGIWQTLGCLHRNLHAMFGKGDSVFVKQYQRSCYRPSCKECYLKWIARQANRATKRIEDYAKKTGKKPIHLMLLVPPSQHDLPYDLLKKRMNELVKHAKWEGGAVIFHPFKFNKKTRQWYYSPHFHLVGFGDRAKISRAFGRYGWYVKIGEERKSVFQTFCYLLSHCGIRKGNRSVIWIGELSYSKVPSEKEPKITGCPICGCVLKPIYYDEVHPQIPPERYFEGLVDFDNHWHLVKTQKKEWTKLERYEYALTVELYHANKGVNLEYEHASFS